MSGTEQGMPSRVALDLAAQRVEAQIGLDFSGAKRRQFDAALGKMAAALGYPSAQACATWLVTGHWDEARSALCARFLTIGETYFFREPRALDLVCDYARAHLARGESRPLRIWSAGCCTGEEPYSIAMALRKRVPHLAPAMATILATDLNDAFIDFARAGVYRRWSFRRTDPGDQAAFFRPRDDGRFEIDATLREQIRFAHLNLASGAYPSAATATLAVDVIFCRNVLMYFGRAQVRQVIARLRDSLVDGGWLVVNASEASAELFAGFTPVYHQDAVFFRKAERPADAAARSLLPAGPTGFAMAGAGPRKPHAAAPAQRAHGPRPPPPVAAQRPAPLPPPQSQPAPQPHEDVLARVRALVHARGRDEALQCLRRAVEANPLSASLQQSAALFAFEQGDRATARHGVRRLLYLDPDSAIGHYLSAMIEDAEGRDAQVRRLLHDCRRLAAAGGADEQLGGAVEMWLERLE